MVQESSLAVTIVARAAYYDRNPLGVGITDITFAVAPHVNTSRGSYTVPANRKAMVTGGNASAEGFTVATTAGAYGASATAAGQLVKQYTLDNSVGGKVFVPISPGNVLNAAQVATIFDEDLSTGGSASFMKVVNLVEFDA